MGHPLAWRGVRFCGAAFWETPGPSGALGITDLLEAPRTRTFAPTFAELCSAGQPRAAVPTSMSQGWRVDSRIGSYTVQPLM
jgi:hypothetical protein